MLSHLEKLTQAYRMWCDVALCRYFANNPFRPLFVPKCHLLLFRTSDIQEFRITPLKAVEISSGFPKSKHRIRCAPYNTHKRTG